MPNIRAILNIDDTLVSKQTLEVNHPLLLALKARGIEDIILIRKTKFYPHTALRTAYDNHQMRILDTVENTQFDYPDEVTDTLRLNSIIKQYGKESTYILFDNDPTAIETAISLGIRGVVVDITHADTQDVYQNKIQRQQLIEYFSKAKFDEKNDEGTLNTYLKICDYIDKRQQEAEYKYRIVRGYTKTEKISAARRLLDIVLNNDQGIDPLTDSELAILKEGKLGEVFRDTPYYHQHFLDAEALHIFTQSQAIDTEDQSDYKFDSSQTQIEFLGSSVEFNKTHHPMKTNFNSISDNIKNTIDNIKSAQNNGKVLEQEGIEQLLQTLEDFQKQFMPLKIKYSTHSMMQTEIIPAANALIQEANEIIKQFQDDQGLAHNLRLN